MKLKQQNKKYKLKRDQQHDYSVFLASYNIKHKYFFEKKIFFSL